MRKPRFGLCCARMGILAAALCGAHALLPVPLADAQGMGPIGGHMHMTALRSPQPGDQ
jgi:hypothetical protein